MAFGPPPLEAMRRLEEEDVDGERESDVKLVLDGELGMERCGEAPRRPMIEGSRWWSCGIALKRCVMRRAPLTTAEVAMSVDAILRRKYEYSNCTNKST